MSAQELPHPWETRVSSSSGDTYYFNRVTEESRWERPAAVGQKQKKQQQKKQKKQKKKEKKKQKKQKKKEKKKQKKQKKKPPPPPPQGSSCCSCCGSRKTERKRKRSLPSGWERRVSKEDDRRVYYYHPDTDVTSFKFPLPLVKGWHMQKSTSSGDTYYVNTATGHSTYDHPGYAKESRTCWQWLCCRRVEDDLLVEGPAWAAASAAQSRSLPDATPVAPVTVDDPTRPLKTGWTRGISRSTGETYYVDEQGESSFDHPGYAAQAAKPGTSSERKPLPIIVPAVGPAPVVSTAAAAQQQPSGRSWDVAGTLNARVIRCSDLLPTSATGFASPKVELTLIDGVGTQPQVSKTSTVEKTLNPAFAASDQFAFQLRGHQLGAERKSCELKVRVWDWNRVGKDDFLGEVTIDLPAALGGGTAAADFKHLHQVWVLTDADQLIPASKVAERGARAYPFGVIELELAFVPKRGKDAEILAVEEIRRQLGEGPGRPAPSHEATTMKIRKPIAPHKHRYHREAYIADGRVSLTEERACCGARTKHEHESLFITNFEQHNVAVKSKDPALAFTIYASDDVHAEKPLVMVAKTAEDKRTWLEKLEATVEHNRQRLALSQVAKAPGSSSALATVEDAAAGRLAQRKRNAEDASRKLHSRMESWGSGHLPTGSLQEHWSIGGPIDRRLAQTDDRDVEGRTLVAEMIASLRGIKGTDDRSLTKMFHDLRFPHVWASVCDRGSFLPTELQDRVEWKRPHEIGQRGLRAVVLHPNGSLVQAEQRLAYSTGRMTSTQRDGWLSGVFCCVLAQSRSLPFVIQNIITSGEDVGLYAVRLFISGRWITVVVDDYFPCEQRIHGAEARQVQWTPLFAAPRVVDSGGVCVKELWPCILEKAWAKYCGSYEAALTVLTRSEDAAAVLTGGIAKTYAVGPLTDVAQRDAGLAAMLRLPSWESVSELLHQRGQMCCCRLRRERIDAAIAVAGRGLPLSVFALVSAVNTSQGKLLRLCAPWTSTDEIKWSGRFGDNLVWTPELRRECEDYESEIPAGRHADDCFWLAWDDFKSYFGEVGVCAHWIPRRDDVLRSDACKVWCSTAFGAWKAGLSAGGKGGLTTARHNPSFRVKVLNKETYLVDEMSDRELHVVVYPSGPVPQDVYLYRQLSEGAFTLHVTVVEANGLPRLGAARSCNPYCKMRVTNGPEAQRTDCRPSSAV